MRKKREIRIYKNLWFVLKRLYKVNRVLFVLKLPSVILGFLFPLASAYFLRCILNALTGGGEMKRVILYAVLLSAAFGREIVTVLFDRWNAVQKEKTKWKIKLLLAEKIGTLPFSVIEQPKMRDFISMAEKSDPFSHVLDAFLGVCSAAAGLWAYAAVAFAAQPLILIFLIAAALFQWLVLKYKNAHEHSWRRRNTPENRRLFYLLDLLRSPKYGKELRVNGLRDWISGKVEKQYREQCLPLARKNAKERNAFLGVTQIAKEIQNLVIYLLLAGKVIFDGMPIGDFTMALSCAKGAGDSLSGLVECYAQLMACGVFAEEFRICVELAEQWDEAAGRKSLSPERGAALDVEFRDVSFRYPNTDRFVLKKVSFHISAGERLSLVGENGSGKSTIIKLICGFYLPTEGEVLIGGRSTREIPRQDYASLLAAVFQDFQLLSFSVRDNIAMGTDCAEARLWESLRDSGLAERVLSLPRGMDSFVSREFDPAGVAFSGGERQKMAIARAICKNAPVILLDEPTAALDPMAEEEIFQKFARLSEGKTAIWVSHRLSATRFSDRIAVLRGGELVEFGSHRELCSKNGVYAALFRAQAEQYRPGEGIEKGTGT